MQKNEKLIGILNDLLRINNDRFECYKNLLTKKSSLHKETRLLIFKMADQSRAYSSSLLAELIQLRTPENSGVYFTAAIYRPTMGLAKAFLETDESAVLADCRQREELVQKAYYDAICQAAEIPDHIMKLLSDQKGDMKITSALIKIPTDNLQAVAA